MGITSWFGKRSQHTVTNSKVLVGSIDPCFRELLESDSAAYSRRYQRVDTVFFAGIGDLLGAIETGYDIVHLFGRLSSGGLLTDTSNVTLPGSELIGKCCERDVKLLWVASENSPDEYIKGFRVAGRPLNLILTISRNGAKFDIFLERLLSRISTGEALPIAWVALVPQAEGPWQQELPGCIFYAGRGKVKLLS